MTILTQHTSDVNTASAFASLRRAFPDWKTIATAATPDVVAAIRCGGLAATKGPRIQAILRTIEEDTGEFSLDWLAFKPMDEARAWLTALHGVGPKTASCVLLFSLGLPAMPVDTHVYRVSRRLGLLDLDIQAERAHRILEHLSGRDRDAVYSLHLDLIPHGRAVCRSRNPACHRCALASLCQTATKLGSDIDRA